MSGEKYVQGMAVRREVLGDDYVDQAISSAADYTKLPTGHHTMQCNAIQLLRHKFRNGEVIRQLTIES